MALRSGTATAAGLGAATATNTGKRPNTVSCGGTGATSAILGVRDRGNVSLVLAKVAAYDVANATLTTLYYGSHGWASAPGDTPASTYFDGRIKSCAVQRALFAPGTTSGGSRTGNGELVLINNDGGLDALLEYGFDGREIVIYHGSESDAFPSGFTTLCVGTMDQPELTRNELRLRVRDRQLELEVPLQPTLYAGTNALPDGVEGVEDLKGKPKPLLYGSARNIAPPCVNTSKLIYQAAEDAIATAAVFDHGMPLGLSDFTVLDAGFSGCISGLAYGDGMFVAVGDNGDIATSPDGTNWTQRDSTTTYNLWDVAYAEAIGMWCVVGQYGMCLTSTDGITWTMQDAGFGTDGIYGVTYGPYGFVAVGTNHVTLSTDGIVWTLKDTFSGTEVAYADGLYITCGTVKSSPTGEVWTAQTVGAGTSNGIAYGNGVWVIVGLDAVCTSTNGINWNTGADLGAPNNVAFGVGRFFAVDISSGIWESVADASAWRRITNPFSTERIRDVVVGSDGTNPCVVVGGGGINKMAVATASPVVTYTSASELEDDTLAPGAGSYGVYLDGGYVRLGSPPAGIVTCDVMAGSTAADRTAAQMWADVLTQAGKTSADWTAADLTTLDADTAAELGYWSGTEPVTASSVLSKIADSVGAWWGVGREGKYRIQRLEDPTGQTAIIAFTANDMKKPLERIATADEGRGLPTWRQRVRYAKNYTPQTDLAGGVTDVRRAELAQEWKEESAETASVKTAYLLAREETSETLLTTASDASAEATRRLALRDSRRDRFEFSVALNGTTNRLDLGDIVSITHTRFGLSAGKNFVIMGLTVDTASRTLTLSVWG